MKLKVLRNWGTLKAGEIIDAHGNTVNYLLENMICSMAPKTDDCIGDCDDDADDECEGCKSKKKKRSAGSKVAIEQSKPAPVKTKKVAPKAKAKSKKKSNKKPASPKK